MVGVGSGTGLRGESEDGGWGEKDGGVVFVWLVLKRRCPYLLVVGGWVLTARCGVLCFWYIGAQNSRF